MKGLEREIRKYDKKDMLSLLKNFHFHCKEGYNLNIPEINKDFNKIVFTGMGGSAIAGDVLKTLFNQFSKIPIFTVRDYTLPEFVDSQTLIIVESYSGNTEETISTYKFGREKNGIILSISSNGEIEKLSINDNTPFIKIPSGMPPRCAFGYLFFPVYRLFVELNILPPLEEEIFEKIKNWVNEFLPENEDNEAIKIAKKFYKKIPIIYSDNKFYPGILRWKTQIAENSKQFAFINELPEMNHNEIMSYYYPEFILRKIVVLFVISGMENVRIKKRIEITSKIISGKIKDVLTLKLKGDTIFEKLLYLIIFGDWVSYYLAILNKVDPTEIKEINILKDLLGKEGK
jgi:glucose/mannose-6-phosphate isomerase